MRRLRLSPAFSLLEIMVAVALITIILSVVIPNFMTYRQSSHISTCQSNLNQIERCCEMHYLRTGQVITDVSKLCDPSVGGVYLKSVPACPIKGSYTIEWQAEQQHFHVSCSAFDTTTHNVHQDDE